MRSVAIVQNVTPNHHHAVYIDGFARNLVGTDYRPIVVLQDTAEPLQFDAIPYELELVKGRYKSIVGQGEFARNLWPVLDALAPIDVIHTMNPFGPLASSLLWRQRQQGKRTRVIYDIRGLWVELGAQLRFFPPWLGGIVDKVDVELANQADLVIAITHELKKILIEKGVSASKIEIVPGGVDLKKFNEAPPFDYARDWGWDGPVIGYVSSIGRGRNSDTIIRAFKRVVDRSPGPVYLAMIGPVRQPEYFTALVQELGLEKVVKLPGFVPHDQVPSMVQGFDIAVSIYPPNQVDFDRVRLPYKVLEYMGAGKPILACNNVCHTNIMTNLNEALMVDPTEEDIANGLTLLLQSPELRDMLGRNARMAASQYAFSSIAAQLQELYDRVLCQ